MGVKCAFTELLSAMSELDALNIPFGICCKYNHELEVESVDNIDLNRRNVRKAE